MNRIHQAFGRARVVIPVVHCCEKRQARRTAELAMTCGADGVFLINQGGLDALETYEVALALATENPAWWIGINLLGFDPHMVLGSVVARPGIRMIWCDEALRVTWLGPAQGWNGLLFGGCAFKGQASVPPDMWGSAAKAAVELGVDVVTTSGRATGSAADPSKPQAMREAIGDHALALASGVTPDNVGAFLASTDAFLVATGIEESFGYFDEARLRRLVELVHA